MVPYQNHYLPVVPYSVSVSTDFPCSSFDSDAQADSHPTHPALPPHPQTLDAYWSNAAVCRIPGGAVGTAPVFPANTPTWGSVCGGAAGIITRPLVDKANPGIQYGE